MTKTICTVLAIFCTLLGFRIIQFSFLGDFGFSFFFPSPFWYLTTGEIFNTCYCESETTYKFVFDYNRLGEGVQPAYHFKDIKRIPDVTRGLSNQSGIYLWHNTLNGDTYVGSAINLFNRTSDYGQPAYLNSTTDSRILNSLRKSPIHWDLCIIELLVATDLIVRENYWISHLNPTLNLLQARSSLGYKHKPEAIEKLRELSGVNNPNFNKTHTPETKAIMSSLKSKTTYKFNSDGVIVSTYISQAEAVKANGIPQSTMSRRMLAVQPIHGFYYSHDPNFKIIGN